MVDKETIKQEVLIWLAEFGREWVDLERYQQQPHEFKYLMDYGMLDIEEESRLLNMRLCLNDRAITFLEGYENLKYLTKV